MGIFSKLFGREDNNNLRKALKLLTAILLDEQAQIKILLPAIQERLKAAPAYDCDPTGTGPFGYTSLNPIPVNGPIGQLAYLSKIETQHGERILFHRLGSTR